MFISKNRKPRFRTKHPLPHEDKTHDPANLMATGKMGPRKRMKRLHPQTRESDMHDIVIICRTTFHVRKHVVVSVFWDEIEIILAIQQRVSAFARKLKPPITIWHEGLWAGFTPNSSASITLSSSVILSLKWTTWDPHQSVGFLRAASTLSTWPALAQSAFTCGSTLEMIEITRSYSTWIQIDFTSNVMSYTSFA